MTKDTRDGGDAAVRAYNADKYPTLKAVEHTPGLVFIQRQNRSDYVGLIFDVDGRLMRFDAVTMGSHPNAGTVLDSPEAWARRLARAGYRCEFYDDRTDIEVQALYEHIDSGIDAPIGSAYGVAPRCAKCGAGVLLDKQDRHTVDGRTYTERIEVCADECGWHGRVHLFAWRNMPAG